jgi:hypothetical protein
MNTAFIFVQNRKLKLSIIRILVENNIPFVEASNIDEALFKLSLINDISLIIEEYQDGENGLKLAKKLCNESPTSQIPILWLIPENRKDLIPLASKWHIADLIPLPLNEVTFIRKVSAIIETNNGPAQKPNAPAIKPKVLSYHSQDLIDALDSAAKGKYPISIIYLQAKVLHEEENSSLVENLKSVLRGSDTVMEVDLGQVIILLPYTPKVSLPIVESKIKDASQKISTRKPGWKIYIYGVCFPDDIQSYDELTVKLEGGIEQSVNISKQAEVFDSNFRKSFQDIAM